MKRLTKALSMFLAIIMVVGLMPLTILAEDIQKTTRYTVLLLDTEKSFTMTSNDVLIYEVDTPIDVIKEAAKNFVDQVQETNGTNYVAVVSYSSTAQTETGFTTDPDTLVNAIDKISMGGQWANINAALEQADALLSNVTTAGAEKNIVLFTQGINFEGKYSSEGHYSIDDCTWQRTDNKIYAYEYSNVTYETAQELHDKYSVYTIGLFQKFNEVPEEGKSLLNFAKRFSSDLQNKGFYDVEDVDDLPLVFEDVAGDIINPLEISLSYTDMFVFVLNGNESYIEISVNGTITNKSNAPAINTRIRIDEMPGLTFISDQKEHIIGDLAPKDSVNVTWKLKAEIPEGEKQYQIKVVAGSNNSVAVEQYLTITVEGNVSVGDFPAEDRWSFEHGAMNGNWNGKVTPYWVSLQDRNWLFDFYTDNTVRDNLRTIYNECNQPTEEWGGSCYGMALSALLFKTNKLSPMYWNSSKTSIDELITDETGSMINYYYFMQYTPEHQNSITSTKRLSEVERIRSIIQTVSESAGLLGFSWAGKYITDVDINGETIRKGTIAPAGHAVIVYGTPETSSVGWLVDEKIFYNRIHIYDVNFRNDDVYLFCNFNKILFVETVDWTIAVKTRSARNPYTTPYFADKYFADAPTRKYFEITSKSIDMITNDMDVLDIRNIEDKNIGNSVAKNEACRIIANDLTQKLRIMKQNGDYSDIDGLVSEGTINYETYYDSLYYPDSTSVPALNILVEEEPYTVINTGESEHLNLNVQYPNMYSYSKVTGATGISFDPAGSIRVNGAGTDYKLTMVFNDGYHTTPWYKTTIEGTDADEITMEQTEDGIVVTGDNLENITITTTDEDGNTELNVSTDRDSILITNNTNDDPVVLIDSDGDGTYDTDITNTKVNEHEQPNTMIFPKLFNVTVKAGEGGKTNVSEKFLIAYGASRTIKITPDEGYGVADILVNGKSVGAADIYSIKGANQNYTVEVIFAKITD